MKNRHYPINQKTFISIIEPLITSHYKPAGRPPKITNYQALSGIFYILRSGIAWRDLPKCFGSWHTIYTRFKRWGERGILWKIIKTLHNQKQLNFNITWVDSTAIKLHRHGAGALKKRPSISRQNQSRMDNQNTLSNESFRN